MVVGFAKTMDCLLGNQCSNLNPNNNYMLIDHIKVCNYTHTHTDIYMYMYVLNANYFKF
jgi:hypothetical protein